MDQIPIFIHHEIGQKAQAGKDNKQQYLKTCLKSVMDFGNDVVLFGDEGNVDWCPKSINVKHLASPLWDEFERYFVNLSTYNDMWAKGIFHRFFYFYEYAVQNNIDEFFVLDSDILLFHNLSCDTGFGKYDLAACRPKRQSLLGRDQMRWTINVGISYWKTKTLKEFLEYCIITYKHHIGRLSPKWEFHKVNGLPGGVCEMTLVYCFVADTKVDFKNIAVSTSGSHFNNNINGNEDYLDKEYKVTPLINIKKVTFIDGIPYFTKKDGTKEKVYGLHFVGDSKLLMNDFYYRHRISPLLYLKFTVLNVRRAVGLILRRMGVIKRKNK